MHAWIQTVVDVLIVVMSSILLLFTLGLIVLHVITTSNSKRVEKIKQRILRMLSVSQDLEYLRGQIYQVLDPDSPLKSLREIRGISSARGTVAMTIVVEEVSDEQRELLRSIILRDEWYREHIRKTLRSRNYDLAGVFTKLIAELKLPGFEQEVLANLYRWPKRADNQEIGLLALFMCGCGELLIRLFSDPAFHLILSFRSLQELFACYSGDHETLFRELLALPCDQYVIRACIRGIGTERLESLCETILPYLQGDHTNLLIDTVRTLGLLRYAPAAESIRAHTAHPVWSVRSAAATALAQIAPDDCREDLLRCLCDREWWVRFHAAEALCTIPGRETLLEDAEALNDRFAFEMTRYILERNRLLGGEVSA